MRTRSECIRTVAPALSLTSTFTTLYCLQGSELRGSSGVGGHPAGTDKASVRGLTRPSLVASRPRETKPDLEAHQAHQTCVKTRYLGRSHEPTCRYVLLDTEILLTTHELRRAILYLRETGFVYDNISRLVTKVFNARALSVLLELCRLT